MKANTESREFSVYLCELSASVVWKNAE